MRLAHVGESIMVRDNLLVHARGQAEVRQLGQRRPIVDEDVVGLDIPVYHPA
jgi:hypothetical protein